MIIKLKKDEHLFDEYELIEGEQAYRVYQGNKEIGTLTQWIDGTQDFWSYKHNREFKIKKLNEIKKIEEY